MNTEQNLYFNRIDSWLEHCQNST